MFKSKNIKSVLNFPVSKRKIVQKHGLDTEEHPFLAYAGPILQDGQVYTVRSCANQVAALNKNLSAQLPDAHLDPELDSFVRRFAGEFVGTGIGCLPRSPTLTPVLYSLWQVVAHAATRSASKAAGYSLSLIEYLTGCVSIDLKVWKGKWFVKTEILKLGKPPRLIFNCTKALVALSRVANYPFEAWIKQSYVTVKGLQTRDRHKPVSVVADRLLAHGIPYVISIDCTARDANVRSHDFLAYRLILLSLRMLIWALDVVTRYSGAVGTTSSFRVSVGWVSLLSGVDFTSTINFIVSYFGAWYFCTIVLGIPKDHWGVAAEGDDNCVIISRPYALAMLTRGWLPICPNDKGHLLVRCVGISLGKRWKVEDAGWLDSPTGHPFVGGRITYYGGLYTFLPLWGRFLLKAGAIVTRDVVNSKILYGRVTARADALTDRFNCYPVGWLYANLVRHHALLYGATARRTKEESYEYESSSRVKWAKEPDLFTRQVFARTYGVSIERQFHIENHLQYLIRNRLYFDDMRAVTCPP